jgi:hypothetical protein
MWQRLGEVCEALANASEAETLVLWHELSGGLLAQACRSAVRDGAIAEPTLARCVGHLASTSLIARLTPYLPEIQRWERDETEDIVREVREEIEDVILAILALRCAAGEPAGAELLYWASLRCDPYYPAEADLNPALPNRPVCWIEACLPSLFQANIDFAEWAGRDRCMGFIQWRLEPALRLLNEHSLDESLQGVDSLHVSALQRLIRICPPRDVRDLDLALAGAGEVRLARWGTPTSAQDLLTLPELVASDDVRVRLVSLLMMPKILDDCASSRRKEPPSEQLQIPLDLPNALAAAQRDTHPVIAGLAVCAAVQMAHPTLTPTTVVELLRDPRPVVRSAAARTVGRMSGGALWGDELAPLFSDPAPSVRLAAVEAVRLLGEPVATPAVLTCLLPLLDDADHEIRIEAIQAAEALGPALTAAFIERLAALTGAESEGIRLTSIAALRAAKLTARCPPVFSALVECFDDCDSYVRECALRAYTDLNGPVDAALLERVTAMVEDRRKGIRRAATALLAKIGHAAGPPSLSSPS